MDTLALSVFLCVADTLNFSRCGQLSQISVSAVSSLVKSLQDVAGQTYSGGI